MKIEKIDGTLLPYTIQGPYRTPCFEGPTKTGIRNWSGVALGRFFATKPSLIGSRRWVGGDGKRQKARITEYRKWPGKKERVKKKSWSWSSQSCGACEAPPTSVELGRAGVEVKEGPESAHGQVVVMLRCWGG